MFFCAAAESVEALATPIIAVMLMAAPRMAADTRALVLRNGTAAPLGKGGGFHRHRYLKKCRASFEFRGNFALTLPMKQAEIHDAMSNV
jgi:hypothetical protein